MPKHVLFSCVAVALVATLATAAAASGIAVQVRDGAGAPLSDAVVYAEPVGTAAPKTLLAGSIEQKGLKFLPLVTVVQTGSSISFPNNDRVRHHIYSFSAPKKFDQKLYSGATATPQVFDKPGTVVLGCNIHDKMLAYVRVVDTPYYAKTDAAGMARIDLPAGARYVLTAWHYRATGAQTTQQEIALKGDAAPATVVLSLALKPVEAAPVSDADF